MLKENQRLLIDSILKIPSASGEKARLLGNKCPACGKVFFPKRMVCTRCFSDSLVEHELSRWGTIYSYTVIKYPHPLGFPVPYAYGLVDIPEDQVRIAAMFTEIGSLHIGARVELVLDKLLTALDGKEVLGFKFRPSKP